MTTYQLAFFCLQQFLTRTFTLPCRSIAHYQQLQGALELSEWEFIEAVSVLETRFDVVLPDESLTFGLTVGELCTLISQQVERSGSPDTIDHSLKGIPDERKLTTEAVLQPYGTER